MGQRDKAIEAAELAWKQTIENHLERFAGPMCLGMIARSTLDKDRQDWAIKEGFRMLSERMVSHNYLYFYWDIMEVGLEEGDWALMQRACDALRDYTRPEPLPWSDFYIARAQALRDFHLGNERDKAIHVLRNLKAQAEQVGLKVALPRIEAVLAEVEDRE